jgi:hypothetical protein
VCGADVITVQHVRKWFTEFHSGPVNVMDEQRSGRPSTTDGLVQDTDDAVQTYRLTSIAQLEMRFNLSRGTVWGLFMKVSATGEFVPCGFPVN